MTEETKEQKDLVPQSIAIPPALMATEDEYHYLLEELKALFGQTLKISREAKMFCAHSVGNRLKQEFDRTTPTYHRVLIRRVAYDLQIDESELYRCIKFFEKFPTFEEIYRLPDGENISWNKIKIFYLPELEGQPMESLLPHIEIDSWGLIDWWKKFAPRQDFVFYITDPRRGIYLQVRSVKKDRVERKRPAKPKKEKKEVKPGSFEEIWNKYPDRIGRKAAERHFKSTVKTDEDYKRINIALQNYLKSKRVLEGFIQNGSTWFNQWQDWVNAPSDHVQGEDVKTEIKKADPDCKFCSGTGKKYYGKGSEQWVACGCIK